MFDAVSDRRQTDKQVSILQNRLRRLEFEEMRTKKKIDETRKKTEDVIRFQQRRINDYEEKMRRNKERKDTESFNRDRFNTMRMDIKNGVMNSRDRHK